MYITDSWQREDEFLDLTVFNFELRMIYCSQLIGQNLFTVANSIPPNYKIGLKIQTRLYQQNQFSPNQKVAEVIDKKTLVIFSSDPFCNRAPP